MNIIPAEMAHLDSICTVTAQAVAQLSRLGVDQWQKGYPNREVWIQNIESGAAWVALDDTGVLGAFCYFTAPDDAYHEIDGAWLTETEAPYASLHRVCVSDDAKGKGVAGQLFSFAMDMARKQGLPSLRIDTHPDNGPMQRALNKAGFIRCGIIRLVHGPEAGSIRVAFEQIL